MDTSIPNDAASSDTEAPRSGPRGVSRKVILSALLVCVALVGLGSAIASTRLSNPIGTHRALPVITLYTRPQHQTPPAGPKTPPGPCNCTTGSFTVPNAPWTVPAHGQYIVVSETKQWLWAYNNGQVVFNTPVVTGRPTLPTPTGLFSVMEKDYGITMVSPWPPGSPNYYYPTYIDYAMLFDNGGYFLHDAWWRSDFGPGANVPHYVDGHFETGSHGCIQMPKSAAYWLITWVNVGTPVRVDP
jgi:lipoprotein-anchoring transpeptidase ErfK/SrfK